MNYEITERDEITERHDVTERGDVMAALPESLMQHIEAAERILSYRFQDRSLLLEAITHPSALEEPYTIGSYERMEFLGDAYLGAIISEMLYLTYPESDEGAMTHIKIALVSGETLSAKAAELGLADVIIFGSSEKGTGRRGLHSALENVFEALVAALVLDGGFEAARRWVASVLSDDVTLGQAIKAENPKSQLQELLQSNHITPTYELVSTKGPAHDRVFTARVLAEGKILATGAGRSIKEAEAAAAAEALSQMGDEI